jgi:hypothetical protein
MVGMDETEWLSGGGYSSIADARKLARHLSIDADAVVPSDHVCYECAFWQSEKRDATRGYGCKIWYLVQLEYGGSIPDILPSSDGKTCGHLIVRGTSPVNCYDCKSWSDENALAVRSSGCASWERVLSEKERILKLARDEFGSGVSFRFFETDAPFGDNQICPLFQMRLDKDDGYGLKVREAVRNERIRWAKGNLLLPEDWTPDIEQDSASDGKDADLPGNVRRATPDFIDDYLD